MSWIVDEDVFFTFVINLDSSFIWYMNMGYTSKYLEVRNSGLSSTPGFLWCLSPNTSSWRSVGQIDYIATTLAQNSFGKCLLLSMFCAISRMILFFLSTMPLFYGELKTVRKCRISFVVQNSWNSFKVNSPPWSDLKALIFWLLSFSTVALI